MIDEKLTGPSRRILASVVCAAGCAEFPKHAKRIIGAGKFRAKSRGVGARARPSAIHAHLPGRAVPNDRFLLISRNIVGAHAGEEIV